MITETLNEVTRKVYILEDSDYYQLFHNPYIYDLFYKYFVLEAPYTKKESYGEFSPIVEEMLTRGKENIKIPFFMFKDILFLMKTEKINPFRLIGSLKDYNVYNWVYSEESFFALYNS